MCDLYAFTLFQLHETVVSQYNIAETVVELYKDRVHMREVDRFRNAHKKVISTIWNEFVSSSFLGKAKEPSSQAVRILRKGKYHRNYS